MVEWGSLLRSCPSYPWTVGSNPTLSAIIDNKSLILFYHLRLLLNLSIIRNWNGGKTAAPCGWSVTPICLGVERDKGTGIVNFFMFGI